MDGFIHSIESFGTLDGPGIRFVIFCQGCTMRCKYCHNPDSWKMNDGKRMSPSELMVQYRKNQAFYKNGGITVTGGEPLLQIDFLLELFELAKQEGVHTCIDTSGVTYRPGDSPYNRKLDQLMKWTDLVMLDIKHMDPAGHRNLTSQPNDGILAFARYLDEKQVSVWIRHVVVPGITDRPEQLMELGRFVGTLSNVKALDVLPYHTMGVGKYQALGIPYPLEGLDPLPKEKAAEAKKIILEGYRQIKRKATE